MDRINDFLNEFDSSGFIFLPIVRGMLEGSDVIRRIHRFFNTTEGPFIKFNCLRYRFGKWETPDLNPLKYKGISIAESGFLLEFTDLNTDNKNNRFLTGPMRIKIINEKGLYLVDCVYNTNKDFYIGATTRTINNRFAEHKYQSLKRNSNSALHKAMRKFGVENFDIEVLEVCENAFEFEIATPTIQKII